MTQAADSPSGGQSSTGSGAAMFARYAYPPNELGYCGPGDGQDLLEFAHAATDLGDPVTVGTEEIDGLPQRRDGNNVQIDRELLTMSGAAGDFARAQTALAARFRMVRYALSEGR